jgi:hypothetical protein
MKMTREQITGAHAEVPSINLGIERLRLFSDALDKFYLEGGQAVLRLSDSHKDQKFEEFEKEFDSFFPSLLEFRKKNDEYAKYLEDRVRFIENEHNAIVFGQ